MFDISVYGTLYSSLQTQKTCQNVYVLFILNVNSLQSQGRLQMQTYPRSVSFKPPCHYSDLAVLILPVCCTDRAPKNNDHNVALSDTTLRYVTLHYVTFVLLGYKESDAHRELVEILSLVLLEIVFHFLLICVKSRERF